MGWEVCCDKSLQISHSCHGSQTDVVNFILGSHVSLLKHVETIDLCVGVHVTCPKRFILTQCSKNSTVTRQVSSSHQGPVGCVGNGIRMWRQSSNVLPPISLALGFSVEPRR